MGFPELGVSLQEVSASVVRAIFDLHLGCLSSSPVMFSGSLEHVQIIADSKSFLAYSYLG